MALKMRSRAPMTFKPRNPAWRRRWTWLHCLGCLVFLVTVAGTFLYFNTQPGLDVRRAFSPVASQTEVIQPGRYREIAGEESTLGDGVEDQAEQDDMGFVHNKRDEQFYIGGTMTLTSSNPADSFHPIPSIYNPYPDYNSRKWQRQFIGRFQPCLGSRGRDLDRNLPEDMVLVYKGKQTEFPAPRFGSYEAMDLDGDVCTDRYARFGAYGNDEKSKREVPSFNRSSPVPWHAVDWNKLQAICLERNAGRYKPSHTNCLSKERPLLFELGEPPRKTEDSTFVPSSDMKRYHPRSAVLIRAWHDMVWTDNHREYLRALVMELALHSGAEYEVFLLVHVKDDALPIFSDMKTVNEIRKSIPAEFRNMSFFFNTKLLEAWYPKIAEHSPVLQHHQPLQIFSQLYPKFDYYWQFEMDARHTGHSYHFLERAISFAKQQPRKYLWERNAYFYTPGAHGSWTNFTKMVHDSLAAKSDNTIWGSVSGTGIRPMGPEPPVLHPDNDTYIWGVGEEADLITFLPIFNPKDTQWTFPDKMWNFKHGTETPRRAAVITMGRYSKRLLDLIHHAQATQGLGLASEMTGASWALYHGLKAVYVPHPIYADGAWTPAELARIYNRGPAENINGAHDSIWNWDHRFDHIMYRLSYMFTTHTAEDLYRRWLGYRTAEHEGGKEASESRYGRLCFPSMFLHPIKNTAREFGPDKAVP